MLKQRIITAVILALFALWALFGWNDFFFALFLLAFSAGCAWEWSNLTGVAPRAMQIAATCILTLTIAIALTLADQGALAPMVLIGVVLWIAIVCDLLLRPVLSVTTNAEGEENGRWLMFALAAFLLLLTICCIFWLRKNHGPEIVAYTIALVAAADTGAYFAGKKFGTRKLAVEISGGKTIEGAMGGLLLALLLALIASASLAGDGLSALSLFLMSVFAAIVSIAGDLFISRAKRTAQLKDSGNLLPGHGGVLDRFDGLLAAVPFIAFAVLWL